MTASAMAMASTPDGLRRRESRPLGAAVVVPLSSVSGGCARHPLPLGSR
ncbi:MAG: hypothetical protein QOE04_5363 [Mycobacterium sp.]|jgi:hypothetical protein|nr:hypothetical protein [Mycobacterium sp.]